jgi:hypothetical protein
MTVTIAPARLVNHRAGASIDRCRNPGPIPVSDTITARWVRDRIRVRVERVHAGLVTAVLHPGLDTDGSRV